MEHEIRVTKRELIGYDTAVKFAQKDPDRNLYQAEYNATAVKLKGQEAKLGDFLKQTGRVEDRARVQTYGFGRGQAQKAVWADKKGLTGKNSSDIIDSGAISGALNPYSRAAIKHAEQYYTSVRAMKTDVENIAKATKYKAKNIAKVKEHLFMKKHDLGGDAPEYFAPDYEIGQSWQRLIDGKNIQPHDYVLLKHEYLEQSLMGKGYSQQKAHDMANKKYNYKKALDER